jgi:hypothetical protein
MWKLTAVFTVEGAAAKPTPVLSAMVAVLAMPI